MAGITSTYRLEIHEQFRQKGQDALSRNPRRRHAVRFELRSRRAYRIHLRRRPDDPRLRCGGRRYGARREEVGPYNEQAVQKIPADQVPNADQLPVGQTVYFNSPYGPMPAKVVSVTIDEVVLDMNHELAGKDLNFDIELVEVVD